MVLRGISALALILVLCDPALGARLHRRPSSQPLRVVVRDYNYAKVSPDFLALVERQASQAFQDIGIQIVWRRCGDGSSPGQADPPCDRPPGEEDLFLRIVTRIPPWPAAPEEAVLGFAGGNYATVSVEAAKRSVERNLGTTDTKILGLAAAHELCHLILGQSSHSSSGLMRGWWRDEDLSWSQLLSMRFAPVEGTALRRAVALRKLAEERNLTTKGSPPSTELTSSASLH